MASASLPIYDILGAPNLIGLIRSTASGVPNPFPSNFYINDKQVQGNRATYYAAPGQRSNATLTAYGAPPKTAQTLSIAEQPVTLLSAYEEINLNPLYFQHLLQYDNLAVQKIGAQEVERHTKDFKTRFSNLRISSMASTLFTGFVYFDAGGNLLPSATGAATSINFQIPNGSATNPWSTGNNIGTSISPVGTPVMGSAVAPWSNTSTNIQQQFTNLRQAAIQQHGFELGHVFYGANIPGYLASNTTLGTFMSRNVVVVNNGNSPSGPEYYNTGEVPDGTLGFKWHKAYQSYFLDQNGLPQTFLGPNQIMICPEPSSDWLGTIEGSYTVPTDVWRKYPDFDAFGAFQMVYGMFAYSIPTMKPPTATMCFGDNFLHILKLPSVVYIATIA